MARRGTAVLASGLMAMIAIGGAGGYGVGWLTALDRSVSATGKAMPLGQLTAVTPPPATKPTPDDSRKPQPDDSKPLRVDDLSYETQTFDVQGTLKSKITLKVPSDWTYSPQSDRNTARFNEANTKRWLRILSGFPLTRPPAASMAEKVAHLKALPANQHMTILSQVDDGDVATLTYTFVPAKELQPLPILRHVIVRWVADDSGDVAVELGVTGLPQDAAALRDVIDHASESVVRRDVPLAPS
ncbi:hypothetical protein ACFCV3_35380 [Kribbella sp. NPDC056345]|uniref:hypothetical protein n=1 Tax=Kribbella sp. NPDC056345 TaxID=3345789 RepID=UPI0035DEEDAB